MISVEQALAHILALIDPLAIENIDISNAGGRILARHLQAKRDQPPFAASAMDGYAVKSSDLTLHSNLKVIGESAAGSRFEGSIQTGQAVRIFTGAPVPEGADRILIQEDCSINKDILTLSDTIDPSYYIRPLGSDFTSGTIVKAPLHLKSSAISLLASMNIAKIPVFRKPIIALIATGDELVDPSETPNKDQIISSNSFGLKALIEANGGIARILPIARDTKASLAAVLNLCEGVDLIVSTGGASVGDHDLIGQMVTNGELETSFYKVAMRPGKPLIAGRYNGVPFIGLPGNPVSALVCGQVFLIPALNAMLGLGKKPLIPQKIALGHDLAENGSRCHYMRAEVKIIAGVPVCHVFNRQDSSLLSIMTQANALMIHPPYATKKQSGDMVDILLFT